MSQSAATIALVAGESSGDQLGAALIEQLSGRYPRAKFIGIGGRHMRAAGQETWWDTEELAVMGLFEVISHLPRLLRLRRELARRLLRSAPDVFIGVDAPDFNLGLETRLRGNGIRTVHYVSPTVWAWRQGRVRKIARAADRVLCLFPFEPAFYAGHGVEARYVGHPMADQIPMNNPPGPARAALGIEEPAAVVALLPGSRTGEVARLAEPMIRAAQQLSAQRPHLQFLAALASEQTDRMFAEAMERAGFSAIRRVLHEPRLVIAAADAVLCASGTATLETMLINRPLAMAYRIAPATYHLAQTLRLVKTPHIALPNILAGERLVPELIQSQATAENMAAALARWLDDSAACKTLALRFHGLHETLRCNASEQAAVAVGELIESTTSRGGGRG